MYIDIDSAIKALKNCTNETDRRIAKWLEELKRRRDLDGELVGSGALKNAYQQGYNEAIDDVLKITNFYKDEWDGIYSAIERIEQLKAGVSNENNS